MGTKKCNIDEKKGLSLIKKHFRLSKETQSSLKEILEYKVITGNRCRFKMTLEGYNKKFAEYIYICNMVGNGGKTSLFRGKMAGINSTTFFIDKDEEGLSHYVKSYCDNGSNHYLVEKIKGTDYFIASN